VIRVLVADDHPIVRQGLRRSVEESGDMTLAGEASSADEVLRLLGETEADVLVLDVFMPGRGFLDLLRRVRADRPSLATLVLSMQPEEQCAVRALRAGARGFVSKTRSQDEVLDAVRAVAAGRLAFGAGVVERLGPSALAAPRLPHETLSDREFEVLCLLGSGRSVKEIAHQLALSPKTVGTYRARLMVKMHVRRDADLVRYAVLEGLSA